MNPEFEVYRQTILRTGKELGIPKGVLFASTDHATAFDSDTSIGVLYESKPRGKAENKRVLSFTCVLNQRVPKRKGYMPPEDAAVRQDEGNYFLDLVYRDFDTALNISGSSVVSFDTDDEETFLGIDERLDKWVKEKSQIPYEPVTLIELMVKMYWLGIERALKEAAKEGV